MNLDTQGSDEPGRVAEGGIIKEVERRRGGGGRECGMHWEVVGGESGREGGDGPSSVQQKEEQMR